MDLEIYVWACGLVQLTKVTHCFTTMNIFINHNEQRPRAGWRLLLQFIIFLFLVFGMMLAKSALVSGSLKIYEAFIMGTAGIGSVWIAATVLDKRPLTEYGISWSSPWKKELLVGLVLGAAAMTVIFIIEWFAGWIEVTGFGWDRVSPVPYYLWILSYFIAMVIIGFYEELIFRGYQILNMVEGFYSSKINLNTAVLFAIAISSVIFGVLHAGNPNATTISTLNIIFAGVIIAIPYLVTGRLAISIGIHISWNFVQGGLFGFAVSGTRFRGSLIQIEQYGSPYITGRNFGPEAGLLGIFGIILILILFYFYIKQQGLVLSVDNSFTNRLPKSAKQDE